MAKVLTVKRADVAAMFTDPKTGQTIFPPSHDREDFQPFHIAGPMPEVFYTLPTAMIERADAEEDRENLQVIPYIVLVDRETNKFFMYERGNKSGEERLRKKCSLGLGGHIDIAVNSMNPFARVVATEALRELNEEVGFVADENETLNIFEGFQKGSMILFTENDDVGTVHVGVCLMLGVQPERLTNAESGVIESGKWLTFDEINQLIQNEEIELEHWSNLVMAQIQASAQHQQQQQQAAATPAIAELNALGVMIQMTFNQVVVAEAYGVDVANFSDDLANVRGALEALMSKAASLMPAEIPTAPQEAANDAEPQQENAVA